MTETETKRNHECSYNKYYNMPSREELHRCYGGYLSETRFLQLQEDAIKINQELQKKL